MASADEELGFPIEFEYDKTNVRTEDMDKINSSRTRNIMTLDDSIIFIFEDESELKIVGKNLNYYLGTPFFKYEPITKLNVKDIHSLKLHDIFITKEETYIISLTISKIMEQSIYFKADSVDILYNNLKLNLIGSSNGYCNKDFGIITNFKIDETKLYITFENGGTLSIVPFKNLAIYNLLLDKPNGTIIQDIATGGHNDILYINIGYVGLKPLYVIETSIGTKAYYHIGG